MIDATALRAVAGVMERRSKSAVLIRTTDREGRDARRPRPVAHCGLLRRRRSPAQAGKERQAKDLRRGGRHALRRAGGARDLLRSPVLRAAKRQLAGLFPLLPSQDAFWKRRARLAD